MAILDWDATTLARKIATREVTSVQATKEYIERLEEVNPKVNCLVEERFSEALKEAEVADAAIARGEVGRLLGVPISMKESFDVKGMKTTGGIPSLTDEVKEMDAEVVSRLRKEGAIILGKTNTPVLCFCQETENKLYGRTNNPWDVKRTAGGSSGGEAALIAVGGAAVGLGSDIGGSIRLPAHFNGVIGFKSGNRQVSQVGSFPYVENALQERMLGIGAMSKSVQDARLINEIIARDIPEERELESFELVFPLESLVFPTDEDTRFELEKVRSYLKEEFSLVDEEPPYYRDSATLWQEIMSVDGARAVSAIAYGKKNPVSEHFREKFLGSTDLHHYFTWAVVGASLFRPKDGRIREIELTIAEGEKVLEEYFASRLLILPVYHSPAQLHGRVYREIFSLALSYKKYMPFVAYANTWGLPVLTVPVGESDGMPIGIQIIGHVGNEDAIFKLGELMVERFRGYVRALKEE